MKKVLVASLMLAMLVVLPSCATNYADIVKEQAKTGNVTPITVPQADEVRAAENTEMTIVTFVMTDSSISSDKVVNIWDFYPGAQGDVLYLVKNESTTTIKPNIVYVPYSRIADYSVVEGQNFFDAPPMVKNWITITPEPYPMPPDTAQGYIVNFAMPEDIVGFPSNFAFQIGVSHGGFIQLMAKPWWLIHMR